MNETPEEKFPSNPVQAPEPESAAGRSRKTSSGPMLIALSAWLVPGLGHLLLRRTARGIVFLIAVAGLAILGYKMRGNVFPPHSTDPFGTLGFLADAASGIFYLLARVFERAGPDVARAAGDYGTRFIAAAGIVNLVSVFDAYEIAIGRRV